MRKIDPTERALDAYVALDTDQRKTFHMALKHIERSMEALQGHMAATPKRGRPEGSKNRAKTPTAQELDLRHNNGAATEGL